MEWPRDAARGQAGGARPASAWPTRSPPRGSSRAGGRRTVLLTVRRRGRRPAGGARDGAFARVAPRQQWQRQSEGWGEEEQAGVQAGEMQPEQRQRGGECEGQRDSHARGHRIGTFSVVVYSSKSDTRSVTASFQSPPGTSCKVLAT